MPGGLRALILSLSAAVFVAAGAGAPVYAASAYRAGAEKSAVRYQAAERPAQSSQAMAHHGCHEPSPEEAAPENPQHKNCHGDPFGYCLTHGCIAAPVTMVTAPVLLSGYLFEHSFGADHQAKPSHDPPRTRIL